MYVTVCFVTSAQVHYIMMMMTMICSLKYKVCLTILHKRPAQRAVGCNAEATGSVVPYGGCELRVTKYHGWQYISERKVKPCNQSIIYLYQAKAHETDRIDRREQKC